MTEITFADVEAKVREYAQRFPDRVYTNGGYQLSTEDYNHPSNACFYQHGPGVPGCIFGHVYLDLGLPLNNSHEGMVAEDILEEFGVELSSNQRRWICEVQSFQDLRKPWGEAVALADEAVQV